MRRAVALRLVVALALLPVALVVAVSRSTWARARSSWRGVRCWSRSAATSGLAVRWPGASSPAASSACWRSSCAAALRAPVAAGPGHRAARSPTPGPGSLGGTESAPARQMSTSAPRAGRRAGRAPAARAVDGADRRPGSLLIADAGLTVAWQEPVSALSTRTAQDSARRRPRTPARASADRRSAGRCRARQRAPAPDRVPRPRAALRRGSPARPSGACGSPRIERRLRRRRRQRRDRPAQGAGHLRRHAVPGRCPGRPRSPATARPTARRSGSSTSCERGDEIVVEMPYGALHLRGEAHRIVEPTTPGVVIRASATTGSSCRPAIRSTAPPSASSSSPASCGAGARRGAGLATVARSTPGSRRQPCGRLQRAARRPRRRRAAIRCRRGMRMQDLKLRVQRADYVVDPRSSPRRCCRHAAESEAVLEPRVVCARRAAEQPTWAARRHRADPGHDAAASDRRRAASAGRRRRTARSPRRRGGELPGGHAELRRRLRDAVGQRQRVEVDLERDAAGAARRGARRRPGRRRGRSSRARPRAASARPSARRGSGRRWRARELRRRRSRGPRGSPGPRRAAPRRAGDADEVAGPGAVAADELARRRRPSRRR